MYLGKVIGRVIATVKNDALEGKKLLLVRRLPSGPAVVAVDAVGAGAGEAVYVCRGREASFAFKPEEVPTEATVVAIVNDLGWAYRLAYRCGGYRRCRPGGDRMIAHLRGKLAQKDPARVIVDVNGVGYEVFVPLTTFTALPDAGSDVSIDIHTHVREDMIA